MLFSNYEKNNHKANSSQKKEEMKIIMLSTINWKHRQLLHVFAHMWTLKMKQPSVTKHESRWELLVGKTALRKEGG